MTQKPARATVLWAFAAVYIIWGSTYLAIRFAIETVPPFLTGSIRYFIAGLALYGWLALRGAPRPTKRAWTGAAISGALMLGGGNGAVLWSEQYVASGVVALLVAVVPLWMVLLDWLLHRGQAPTLRVITGLLLGFGGMVMLIKPGDMQTAGGVHLGGALVVVLGSLSWALGSLYSRRFKSSQPFQSIALQMLCGAATLLVMSMLAGESMTVSDVSSRSILAILYLASFGSIIGFTAYVWLLGHVSPARVSTYAYVNPIVAVVLGWALAHEPLTLRMLLASAVIVFGVALITLAPSSQQQH